jgi:nucleoside-diphosphate-sugar epimerase
MIDLKDKVVCVLGSHGFIGSSLVTEIKKRGGKITTTPTKDSIAILHFASYTHIPFEKNPAYHTHELLSSFMYCFNFCKENNIPFIYPSSALIYEAPRPFYWLKKITEEMQNIYRAKSLALRIFPVYGVGEGERGHPTAIQQWIKQMLKGERPIVYGDGTQSRDFIYISDVVDNILDWIDWNGEGGIRDIGVGKPLVFNDIIKIINKELGTNLKPIYKSIPQGYAKGIKCPYPVQTKVDICEGVRRMIKELKE